MDVGGVNPNERQSGQVRRFFISSVLNSEIIPATLRMPTLVELDIKTNWLRIASTYLRDCSSHYIKEK